MIVQSDFVASGSMDEGTPILERLTEEELARVTDLGAIKSGTLYRFQIKRLFIDRAEIFRGVGKARSDLAAFLFRRRENLLPIPHAPDEYARFKGGVESIWFAVKDPAGEELREIYNIPTGLPLFRTLNGQAGLVELPHPALDAVRALSQVLVQPTIEARIEALRKLGKSENRLLRSEALEGIRYLETTRADRK